MALNLYATLTDIKDSNRLDISATTNDDLLEALLENASRVIDGDTHRFFYTKTETKHMNTSRGNDYLLLPEDLISIDADGLTVDTESDGTYDGQTWTEATDFWTYPYEEYPKYKLLTTGFGSYSFASGQRRDVQIVGIWGYGDGTSDPWSATIITGTVGDGTTTTLDLSLSGTVKRGHTIKCGTEQMYVSAIDETSGVDTATVTRGVNGTTAAAQAAAVVSIAQYPSQIKQACLHFATRFWTELADTGQMQSERIGSYSYSKFQPSNLREQDLRLVAIFRRIPVV